MVSAVSVVLMLPTVIGLWTYALPAFAGILIMFVIVEIDKKWAAGVYVAVSLLSILLLPNKEAAVFYLCFFGHYPIIKSILESKLPRVAEYILKILVFNVSVVLAALVMTKIFGMPMAELLGTEGETAWWVQYALPITLVAGNITFVLFDKLLTMTVSIYLMRWQKRFRRMFPFK